jgi:hypothetical protein
MQTGAVCGSRLFAESRRLLFGAETCTNLSWGFEGVWLQRCLLLEQEVKAEVQERVGRPTA